MLRAARVIVLVSATALLCRQAAGAAVRYVSSAGSDANSGSSWVAAKRNVQAAINSATGGDEVWVAKGTYLERIQLKEGVDVYGGFAGNESAFGQRNIATNITTLDGQQGGSVVIAGLQITRATVIDGFTIRNGVGSYIDVYGNTCGGGVACDGSPTVSNNRVINNSAHIGGGVWAGYGSPAILNNLIDSNSAVGAYADGGGISCAHYTLVSGNTISNNTCVQSGAGVSSGGSPTIENNTITGNTTSTGGGAGISFWGSYALITGNTVVGNVAGGYHGGGIACFDNAGATIADCTVRSNRAAYAGGGIFVQRSATSIMRCMIDDNTSQSPDLAFGGGGIASTEGQPYIVDCRITNNRSTVGPGGGVQLKGTKNPRLERCIITGNSAGSTGGGLNIAAGANVSPASVANCLIARNTSGGEGAGIACAGYVRFYNNTIVENTAAQAEYAGGLAIYSGTSYSHFVLNNIIAFNSSGLKSVNGSPQVAQDNCVYGNSAYDYDSIATGLRDFTLDPLFRDMAAEDYRLLFNSPCIDTGDDGWVADNDTDLAGNPRTAGTHVDRGALEYTVVVSGLSVSPSSVFGGDGSTGTVTLSDKAPAGGLVVAISSSKPDATVPSTVTVTEGASSAAFSITTKPVGVKTTSVIGAALGTSQRTTSLYIYPPVPKSITYSPSQVRGGMPSTATLTLTGKAPAGGLVVSLEAINPTVVKPDVAAVTVAAGQTSAAFGVTTYPVASLTVGVIKATANGKSIQIGIRVYPAVPRTITFSANPIHGGKQVTATLTLTSPAPAGGLVVTLGSQNTALATVPASVTVAEGQTTATFPVQTFGVATQQLAVVTASANGYTIYFGLRLYPAVPKHIQYSPNPVKGGNDVTATLFLHGAAPPGGLTVALAAQHPQYAAGPSTVVVPAGASQVDFTVESKPVTSQQLAVFKATANGVSIFIGLRVWP